MTTASTESFVASQRTLIWWRFRKHKLALAGLAVTALLYLVAAFCEFLAPNHQESDQATYAFAPPQRVHLDWDGLYTYGYTSTVSQETLEREFRTDESQRVPLGFLVKGDSYRLWGLFEADRHLFGAKNAGEPYFALGADRQGRDQLSRLIYGTRISMSVGLIGVGLSLLLGIVLGGVSGYFGGAVDSLIQRVIEFIIAIPSLPLWLGLAAAVPPDWGPVKTYAAITVILSLLGWTGLARVVRGKFLQLRTEDFVLAAELDGARKPRVIFRHMLPGFTSHIIATLTMAIPGMILAETALSFLGLGLQPPAVSWGVLLQDAQDLQVISSAPWLLMPGVAVMVAVVALNFLGDGLRDAADPYEN